MFFFSKAFKQGTIFFTLSFLLLSGTVSANTFVPPDPVSVERTSLPPLDRAKKTSGTFRSLAEYENLQPTEGEPSGMEPVPSVPVGQVVPPASAYLKDFIPDVKSGTKNIFSRDNLPIALIGTGLTGLALTVDHLDRNVKNYFQTRRPMNGISKYGDMIGQGIYHVGIGGLLFGAGELMNDKKLADTGIVTLEALLVNGIATEGLKYLIERRRPNGGDRMSFPSGHSSSTATLAASISAMYDWNPKITIPLYLTAAFVGASRIQDNEHYLSDVLAGLTLGTIVGASFARHQKEKDKPQKVFKSLSISPLFQKDLKGCLFTFKW